MGDYGEIKTITARMPSGAATASGVSMQGYRHASIYVPVITSALLSFGGVGTGGAITPMITFGGVALTALTPGGTGGVFLVDRSDGLDGVAGHPSVVHISAAAAQQADRDFVWYLKG